MGPVGIHPDPLPIQHSDIALSRQFPEASCSACLDGIDPEIALSIALLFAIAFVVVDEGFSSHGRDPSSRRLLVNLGVGATGAPVKRRGRRLRKKRPKGRGMWVLCGCFLWAPGGTGRGLDSGSSQEKLEGLWVRGCTCGCFVAPCFSLFRSVTRFQSKRKPPNHLSNSRALPF